METFFFFPFHSNLSSSHPFDDLFDDYFFRRRTPEFEGVKTKTVPFQILNPPPGIHSPWQSPKNGLLREAKESHPSEHAYIPRKMTVISILHFLGCEAMLAATPGKLNAKRGSMRSSPASGPCQRIPPLSSGLWYAGSSSGAMAFGSVHGKTDLCCVNPISLPCTAT